MKESRRESAGVDHSSNAKFSAAEMVSNRFNDIGDAIKRSVNRLSTSKVFWELTIAALLLNSGCANVPTPIEPTPIAGPITPEKQSLIFDGNHVLVIPHSAELDGKEGMEIDITFKPDFRDFPKISENLSEMERVEAIELLRGHRYDVTTLVTEPDNYSLGYVLSVGSQGQAQMGIEFIVGGQSTGFYPADVDFMPMGKDGKPQTVTMKATVDQSGNLGLTLNDRKIIGYGYADRLSADEIKRLESGSRPVKFNNNGQATVVGGLLNEPSATFKGTMQTLQVNGEDIDLNSANLQKVGK